MQFVMAATSCYSTKEDKILYNERYGYIQRRKKLRCKIQQQKIIILCGAVLAAQIIVIAATTGAQKEPATAPVGSVPQSITQEEEDREVHVSTSTSTIETTSSITKPTATTSSITEPIVTEPLPPEEPAIVVFKVSLEDTLQVYTYKTCEKYNVTDYYTLVMALMWVESRYDASAISATNDYGLMQINKGNHEWLSEQLAISDFLDARQNIEAGVYLLSSNLLKYGDVHKALMAYNMGPRGASKEWDKGLYTSAYSRKVVVAWEELKATGTITE